MPISAESYVWPLRDMIVVTVHGTPDEAKQIDLLKTVHEHIGEDPDPRVLYILSQDADVDQLSILLAIPEHEAARRRVAYAVSTMDQLEALREHPDRPEGSSTIRVFGEVTAAYGYLSG